MNYHDLITTTDLADNKLARDLAWLLDSSCTQIDMEHDSTYTTQRQTEIREMIFDRFCRLCAHNGVDVPELEPNLIRGKIRDHFGPQNSLAYNSLKALEDQVEAAVSGADPETEEVQNVLALMRVLWLAPKLTLDSYFGRLTHGELLALINHELLSANLPLIRPNYFGGRTPESRHTNSFESKILVVDDKPEELVQTLNHLAGMPDASLDFIHFEPSGEGLRDAAAQREWIIAAIVARKPDLLLLDNGLSLELEGYTLVKELREQLPELTIIANTGGEMNDFQQVGVYKNYKKGKKPEALNYI